MSSPPDAIMTRLHELAKELPLQQRLELIEQLTAVPATSEAVRPDPEALIAAHAAYSERHQFREGQLVQWKPKLRNKRLPEYGQPAIVVSVLDEPTFNDVDPSDSPYYRERLDIILGVMDGTGDLIFFHFDAGRFEPATTA